MRNVPQVTHSHGRCRRGIQHSCVEWSVKSKRFGHVRKVEWHVREREKKEKFWKVKEKKINLLFSIQPVAN